MTFPFVHMLFEKQIGFHRETSVDGTALNLSDKDQKWLGLKDTFKF